MTISKEFLRDSIRQLRRGLDVIAFNQKQVDVILKVAKEKYNLSVSCHKIDYYFLLKPEEKQLKNYNY